MPKRVGYLYDKMVDRDFIRAVIQEAAKGRRSRKDIAPVLADLGMSKSPMRWSQPRALYRPSRRSARSMMRAARNTVRSRWSHSGRTA